MDRFCPLNHFCVPHAINIPWLDAEVSLGHKREMKLAAALWLCVSHS